MSLENGVRTILGLALAACLALTGSAAAQSGGPFDLSWNTVDGGGVTFATGGPFILGGTTGQPDAGMHTGSPFVLSGGFWFAATDTFTVAKDFSDDSSASVTVTVTCSSGVVSPSSATASESSPAVFTVTGYVGTPTCTATETPLAGYIPDETACANVALTAGGCTIVNTLTSTTFTVNKDFSDNNAASVSVNLTCSSGTVTTSPLSASESSPAVFTVTGYSGTPTCTATEASFPNGYVPNETACANVPLSNGNCTIVNTLTSGTFTVSKDFSDNNAAAVSVNLTCSSGTVTTTPLSASESSPAVFTVTGYTGSPTCTATEAVVPSGYTVNETACANVALGGGCTIVNTLNSNTFTVNKDFSDNNAAAVSVSLTCSSGTVTSTPLSASEGSPAVFTVTGFTGSPTCTATEVVPSGYTADQAGCVNVALGSSCTIVNTLNSGTFTVNKDFSDNNAASVSVNLTCSSGTVATTPLPASEGSPAVFTVTGYGAGTTCTATEAVVPSGYTANESACANAAIGSNCTIVNTLNGASFIVSKDFSDNNAASVSVNLTCTSGTVTTTPLPASEGSPAVFTVTGFSGSPTCTATEVTVPAGYTVNESACANVALGSGCTIVNQLNAGVLTITQNTTPSSNTVFDYTAGGGLTPTSFSLTDGQSQVFNGVAPGSGYSIVPTIPPGYVLTSAVCSDGSDPTNINFSQDESITCTFTMALAAHADANIPVLDDLGRLLLALGLGFVALLVLWRRT